MTHPSEQIVLDAAAALVRDFASGDSTAYFAHFAPDATFVFHTHPERLESRAAYEALWLTWAKEDDFTVLDCQSTGQRVQLFGDTAVFTHTVETRVSTRTDGVTTVHERETIVFHHTADVWIAVHEHLSPAS